MTLENYQSQLSTHATKYPVRAETSSLDILGTKFSRYNDVTTHKQ